MTITVKVARAKRGNRVDCAVPFQLVLQTLDWSTRTILDEAFVVDLAPDPLSTEMLLDALLEATIQAHNNMTENLGDICEPAFLYHPRDWCEQCSRGARLDRA